MYLVSGCLKGEKTWVVERTRPVSPATDGSLYISKGTSQATMASACSCKTRRHKPQPEDPTLKVRGARRSKTGKLAIETGNMAQSTGGRGPPPVAHTSGPLCCCVRVWGIAGIRKSCDDLSHLETGARICRGAQWRRGGSCFRDGRSEGN
jgi:hypothetical protein